MAITLIESAKLSQNKLKKGVIQEVVKASPILKMLPFETIVGNSLAYNREDPDNPATVQFRPVDGVWTESTAKYTQVTASLKILGGDADVDNFIQQTRSNINNQMANAVKLKSKAMSHAFENECVYGDADVENGFDGLHNLVSASQSLTMAEDATGAPLSIAKLDELIDLMVNGCDALIMNKNIRRRLTQYLRPLGSYTTKRDDYGNFWMTWGDDIPIIVSDFITQTELCDANGMFSAKTGGQTSSIFAVKFGEGDGLVGIQNGGIETEVFEKLETKDASRTRLKWYCGIALYSTLSLARLGNITDAAVS